MAVLQQLNMYCVNIHFHLYDLTDYMCHQKRVVANIITARNLLFIW